MAQKLDFSCQLAGHNLKTCLYNASGPRCTTREELLALAESTAQNGAILSKSCTLAPRAGNAGVRYHYDARLGVSVNSTGLANEGYQFYGQFGKDLKEAGLAGKPYFVSVAGLSRDDNLAILDYLRTVEHPPTAIELNLSCPNIIGKPQMGYDFEGSRELLQQVFALDIDSEKILPSLGLKLPPYFDSVHFESMATVIREFPLAFVTCCNSLGHCLLIDPERECPVIHPNKGHGGFGGSLIKPVALANVRKFRELLPERIGVIGCGGVQTGEDVFEHLLCGATAVQVGTRYAEEGPVCFERILKELGEIMKRKGYTKVSDFRGKLRDYYE